MISLKYDDQRTLYLPSAARITTERWSLLCNEVVNFLTMSEKILSDYSNFLVGLINPC